MSEEHCKHFEIRADYTVTKFLTVQVKEGEDPMDPEAWLEIVNEFDDDVVLDRVVDAIEAKP